MPRECLQQHGPGALLDLFCGWGGLMTAPLAIRPALNGSSADPAEAIMPASNPDLPQPPSDRLHPIGNVSCDGIFMDDLRPAAGADECDLQLGLKLFWSDVNLRPAFRTGDVGPVVSQCHDVSLDEVKLPSASAGGLTVKPVFPRSTHTPAIIAHATVPMIAMVANLSSAQAR